MMMTFLKTVQTRMLVTAKEMTTDEERAIPNNT